jgi:16S rRNA G966 N2-methylase RsmD
VAGANSASSFNVPLFCTIGKVIKKTISITIGISVAPTIYIRVKTIFSILCNDELSRKNDTLNGLRFLFLFAGSLRFLCNFCR